MDQNVVRLPHPARRLPAESPHRTGKGKDPDGGANSNPVIFFQIIGDRTDRHIPAVHGVPAAPPEARRALRPLRGTDFKKLCPGLLRQLIGQFLSITHAGKIDHQMPFVCPHMGILLRPDDKGLLLGKYAGSIARGRLRKAEEEVSGGHEIQREHIELDAYPQHQRHAEDTAQGHSQGFFAQQQSRCRQIGQAVDDQQCDAGKHKVLKQHIRKWKHLKIRQHGVHAHSLAGGIDQHPRCAGHGSQADEQRPENQKPPGGSIPGMSLLVRFMIHFFPLICILQYISITIICHACCLSRKEAFRQRQADGTLF